MPVRTRAHAPVGRSPRRLGTAALLGLAACPSGGGERSTTGPICLKCVRDVPPAPPPPPPPPPTHHGIVSGILRDSSGAPLVGTPWLTFVGPAGAGMQPLVEGARVTTPADGTFRMRYVVGFGTVAPDSIVLELHAQPIDSSYTRLTQRLPLRRPRLLSEPPDSAVIALYFRKP